MPHIDISTSGPDITHEQSFEGVAEPWTIRFDNLYDWRSQMFWNGPLGRMAIGSWGFYSSAVFVRPGDGPLPCPVCFVLGGFHDDEGHRHRAPADKLLPVGDSKRALVRLSADQITERREVARQRREEREHG